MIQNINGNFGDAINFESVEDMVAAIRELNNLNPGEGYVIPADGLKEGRDYITI